MPKASEHIRFRTHRRKGKDGQEWISYSWDGRAAKMKDIPLGTDYNVALAKWQEIERGQFPGIKTKPKVVARRLTGKRRKFDGHLWMDLPAWGKRMFLNAEKRAFALGQPFLLTVDDLAAAIKRADGHCEVSGIAFEGEGKRHPFSPSVDRIDSSIGYRADNIRVVCLIANFAMNTWGDEPLHRLAEHVWRKRDSGTMRNVSERYRG